MDANKKVGRIVGVSKIMKEPEPTKIDREAGKKFIKEVAEEAVTKMIDPEPVLFDIHDKRVCSDSNARYIYVIMDAKDKALIMMLTLPHIRQTIIDGRKVSPEKTAILLQETEEEAAKRINRLCLFGAIVTGKKDKQWVGNPDLVSVVSQRS